MRVYVAGPMRGLHLFNWPAFEDAVVQLAAEGHVVISPTQIDEALGMVKVTRLHDGTVWDVELTPAFDFATVIARDLEAVGECDAVALLPGWSKSEGAKMELAEADRLGKLVMYLPGAEIRAVTPQPLVGLIGFAQSGKDTFAATLGYRRIAFADALRQLALAADLAIPEDGGSLRSKVQAYGWDRAKVEVPGVRGILQDLGVAAREVIGPDVWVDAAFRGYDPAVPTVFTDVRFPNEIAAIRERGGVIVRVHRPGVEAVNGHVSERAWQDEMPDYYVWNTAGLDHLEAQARLLDADLRAS